MDFFVYVDVFLVKNLNWVSESLKGIDFLVFNDCLGGGWIRGGF